ncbi:discoidin domain-containing protein [Streptomyces sp. M19]
MSRAEMFAHAAGVTDFGTGPGLVSHQSTTAWAGAVTKPGFVKFAWQPGHDDWLFRLSGGTAMFLPSTTAKVTSRTATVHTTLRDGFDGSATLLRLDNGFAGYTTLPPAPWSTPATRQTPAAPGWRCTTSPCPAWRGWTAAAPTGTRRARPPSPRRTPKRRARDLGRRTRRRTGLHPASVRHLRVLGVRPDPQYGYSLYAVEARHGADGQDSRAAVPRRPPPHIGHGTGSRGGRQGRDPLGRLPEDRQRTDSWWAVDLGATHTLDRVTLRWETAGRAYRVQGSADGQAWTDLATGPAPRCAATVAGWTSTAAPDWSYAAARGPWPCTATPSSPPTRRTRPW